MPLAVLFAALPIPDGLRRTVQTICGRFPLLVITDDEKVSIPLKAVVLGSWSCKNCLGYITACISVHR